MSRIKIADLPVQRDIFPDELEDIFGAGPPRYRPAIEALEQRDLMSSGLAVPLHFDFGPATSPVAPGYTGVSLVAYTQTQGYGWQSLTGLGPVDRQTGNLVTGDFIRAKDATFLVNVPNATYDVTPTLGDALFARGAVEIWAQGQQLASGLITNAGQFISPTYKVQVTDGQLNLRFVDTGGLTELAAAVDAVDIVAAPVANAGPKLAVAAGAPVTFAGSASGSSNLTYSWNFGDNATTTGTLTPTHTYSHSGTYTATLTVTDALGISSTSTTTVTVNASPVYKPATGIYAVFDVNKSIPKEILSNPYVSGIAVRATWDFIEPMQGVYNWSYLDSVINAAAAAGKQVSLSIRAGENTPAWVYTAGAQAFSFIDATSPNTQTIPLPWDPVFLTQWTDLIQQLGARYASNSALTQVKITGINYATAETLLPNSHGQTISLGSQHWTTTNDVADWQAAGYTRLKVENAWQTIADAWSKAFPNQQIAAILAPNNFPPIDNNGNVFSDLQNADNQIVTDLINLGTARYGSQFVVQNNALSDTFIYGSVTGVANQVTTGYQMLWQVTGDTMYRMNAGMPIAITTELQNALNSGIAAKARFLEVYGTDILNPQLQNVLHNAQAGLAQNALPLGTITGLPAPGSFFEGTNTFTLGSALANPNGTSAAGYTYAWTVAHNGQTVATGTASSLTFTATDSGAYLVSLQVTDAAGHASFVNTQTITIANVAPTIGPLSVPLSIAQGAAATFSATATDPGPADMAAGFTYTWKFGNGHTATGSSVSYTYQYAGTFTVTLIVTDAGGASSTTTTTVTVTKPTRSPEGAPITLNAGTFPAPAGVDLTGATYAWTVTKNGAVYATGSAGQFTFTPDDLSSYLVTQTVTAVTGQSWTNSALYSIANLAPTITGITAPVSQAQGIAATFSATATDPGAADMAAGLTYSWRFGNGDTATGSSVTYTYRNAGTYHLVLTVTDAEGASTTTLQTVTVTKPTHSPEGSPITLNASTFPAPAGVNLTGATYAWTVTKNGAVYATGSAAQFTLTPDDLSSYLVTQTVTAATGQSWTNSALYTIDNLPPTITGVTAPVSQAMGIAATFSATAIDPGAADMAAGLTYSWRFGNGDTATGSSVTYTYRNAGTFNLVLTVTDAEGAHTTTMQTITVTKPTHSPEGSAIALDAHTFPAPAGVNLTGATYAWTVTKNGAVYATGSSAKFKFTPNDLSNYVVTLTVTDKAGQTWTDTVAYVIDNLPPTITSTTVPSTASQGAPVTFSAKATDPGRADTTAGLTYSWRFGDFGTATGSTVTHTYLHKGTYKVTLTVTDQEGAKTTSLFTIIVS
jgi:PKD repeat protein